MLPVLLIPVVHLDLRISTTPVANLPSVSTTLAKLVAKFATGFVDTGGSTCEYLCEFSKKFETVLIGYSGAGGKWIHEKNQK